MSLTQRVLKGGFWATIFKITVKCLSLLRIVILARLLGPEVFGLMTVVLMCLDLLYLFSQMGVNSALIQKKDDVGEYLGTAWSISIVRGIFLSVILYVSAPLLAAFFNNPGASSYIKAASVAPFLLGLVNIRMIYLERDLNFNKKFLHETVGVLVDMFVSIILALIYRNAWSLVFGLLAGNIARLIYSFIIVPFKFKLEYKSAYSKELFHFGKWIFLNGILVFVIVRGGDLFVAKFVDIKSLGYYTMASRVATLIPGEMIFVFSQVLFPAFSKIQDEKSRLKLATLKVANVNSIVGFPLALMTCLFAKEITLYIFGTNWLPMIPLVQILAFLALLVPVSNSFDSLYMSLAKTHLLFFTRILQTTILFLLLYYFTIRYSVKGAAAAILSTQLILLPIYIFVGTRMAGCSIIDYLRSFKEAMISSAAMAFAIIFLKNMSFLDVYPKVKLAFLILTGGIIYYFMLVTSLRFYKNEMVKYLDPSKIIQLISPTLPAKRD